MKFSTLLILLLAIPGLTPSYAQTKLELEWINDIGSDSTHETVFSTAVDTKGNVIVLTRTWDREPAPTTDIFKVQKYDPAGEFIWEKELKATGLQMMLPGGLCIDSNDNIFFLLNTFNKSFYFETTLFECPHWESTIFKLSNNGDLVWTKQIDRLFYGWGMEDNTALLAIDRNNDLIFTGGSRTSDSTFKIDGVPFFETPVYGAFFVAKFTNDGVVLWAKLIDQRSGEPYYSHSSQGNYVAVDSSNNIYVLGTFGPTFRNNETVLTSEGALDMFLAKIRPTGELLWINRIGGSLENKADWPWGLVIDKDNNAYAQGYVYEDVTITGWTGVSTGSSSAEIFICKFDPTGKVVWNKRIQGLDYRRLGTTVDDCPMGLAYSGKDNSIICRSHLFIPTTIDTTTLTINSEDGVPALWAYTADGDLLWTKVMEVENGYVQFNDVDVDRDGNIFMGGCAGRYWTFDRAPQETVIEDTTFLTFGGADGALAKFSVNEFSNVASGDRPIPSLSVYPNPFSERTTIDLPADLLRTPSTLQIHDVLGAKVVEVSLPSNSTSFVLERGNLAGGIYHYKVVIGSTVVALGEFIIQ